jgi:Predicted ornithine cyclodeaminase, mu-crystallin homolog
MVVSKLLMTSYRLGEIVHPNSVGVLQDPRDRKQDLRQWLQTGNVIYKSVGFGLMDLTVGTYLIQLANEKGVGTRIEGF